MKLNSLLEMPEFKEGNRDNRFNFELCSYVNIDLFKNLETITVRTIDNKIDLKFNIYVIDNKYYFITNELKIVSILEAKRSEIVSKYFKGAVFHEESIDTCSEYRGKGLTTNFYYSIIKNNMSILSDYKHYTGTKKLWKSLSKYNDVEIRVFKNNILVSDNYDLVLDPLNVWSTNSYLILASKRGLHESLERIVL